MTATPRAWRPSHGAYLTVMTAAPTCCVHCPLAGRRAISAPALLLIYCIVLTLAAAWGWAGVLWVLGAP